jgi:arylsulfatase A-like enzyme/uncharacterized membrane protein YbhN (UPF0104 family)
MTEKQSLQGDETVQEDGLPASLRAELEEQENAPPPTPPPPSGRKRLWLALKVGVSIAGLAYVWSRFLGRDGAGEILGSLGNLDPLWFLAAIAMQCTAIFFAVRRWRLLLEGQGIHAPYGFLVPSFMIGRFWGALTPGGLGLDGWKLFDVTAQTGKLSRATALLGTEKILGQLAMGLVVMGGSVWGTALLGVPGVLGVNAFFVVLVTAGITFLSRPELFLWIFRLAPSAVRPRLLALVEALRAYRGKNRLLALAVAYGAGIHAFNNLIYVCAARALGIELDPGIVFFGSTLQIIATLLPISFNGVGLREYAASQLYAGVMSPAQALLVPTVGFAAEMIVSATGALFLVTRRAGYDAGIVVDDADREQALLDEAGVEPASGATVKGRGRLAGILEGATAMLVAFGVVARETASARPPSVLRGLVLGFGAGLVGGMIVGLAEGAVVIVDGGGRSGYGVLVYGAVAYGVFSALGTAFVGAALMVLARLLGRAALPEPAAFGRLAGLVVAAFAFALGVFRIRRDVFHEELALKSAMGLAVLGGCALGGLLLYLGLGALLRHATRQRWGAFLLQPWGAPAFVGATVALLFVVTQAFGPPGANAENGHLRPPPPEDAPNVLFIVVDTLRADHLPAYGYSTGSTPNLDRFADDAIRFDQAFANASWTRPSFASMLTGRYASSHGVMSKSDGLPESLMTLPEVLSEGGYATAGFVTNYNVAPHYNFQQGFDEYAYLEPQFILGADDAAAKLLLMQVVRRGIERFRAMGGRVEPGAFYQDAETVNGRVFGWLENAPRPPFFLFTAYMDPHDPYYAHPYDGEGYARAAHQRPDPSEADALRAMYDGEITYWDAHFGALMDELRRRGLYDDMLIVVTSDHGEEFAEHGGFWHGTTLYDEQVRVPLFVKLPGNARAGTTVDHWVQSIDLMPSILTRVGLEVPEGVQGRLLEEGTERVYAEESHEGNVLEAVRERRDFRAYKLIRANEGNPRGLAPYELYLVEEDPAEQDDRAEAEPEALRAMTESLAEARTAAAEGAVEAVEVERGQTDLQQQCNLGYASAEECCRERLLSREMCESQGFAYGE